MAKELIAIPIDQYKRRHHDNPAQPERGIPRNLEQLVVNTVPLEKRKQVRIMLKYLSELPRFAVNEAGEVSIDDRHFDDGYIWDLFNTYFRNLPSKGVPGYKQFIKLLSSMDQPADPASPRSYIDELKEPLLPVPKKPRKRVKGSGLSIPDYSPFKVLGQRVPATWQPF